MICIGPHLALIEIGYLIQNGMGYRVSACRVSAFGGEGPSTGNTVIDDRRGAIGHVLLQT